MGRAEKYFTAIGITLCAAIFGFLAYSIISCHAKTCRAPLEPTWVQSTCICVEKPLP